MPADVLVTICGNTTAPPDLQFGASGVARCSFTLAVNSREKQQDGSWGDGPATYYRCTAWRQLAENVAQTCGEEKSTRLLVHGRFKARPYEANGEKRLSLDVEVEHVGPDLRFATASVGRVSRDSGGGGLGGGQQQTSRGGDGAAFDDPWSVPAGGSGAMDPTDPPFAR